MSEWPTFTMYSEFGIISLGQALARGKWSLAGLLEMYEDERGQWQTGVKRTISADATPKRYPGRPHPVFQCGELKRDVDIWRSEPYAAIQFDRVKIIDTVPYDKSFGHELEERQQIGSSLTPDGDALGTMMKIINGSE